MRSCLDDVCHEGCMLLENLAPNIRAKVVIDEPSGVTEFYHNKIVNGRPCTTLYAPMYSDLSSLLPKKSNIIHGRSYDTSISHIFLNCRTNTEIVGSTMEVKPIILSAFHGI
jgi:hypothetical protein